MKSRCLVSALSLVAVLVATCVVEAQQERQRGGQPRGPRGGQRGGFGGPGGFPGRGGGPDLLGLVRNEAVQKELELIAEQTADLGKLIEEARSRQNRGRGGERPDFRNLSDAERQKLIEDFRKQREAQAKVVEEKLSEILLPHQMGRLKEIHLQQQGIAALGRPEVAKALGLSPEQLAKIGDVQRKNGEAMREQMRALFGGGRGGRPERPGENAGGDRNRPERGGRGRPGNFEEIRAKMEEMRDKTEQEVLAVLTADQRSQFAKMKGDKFEMPRPNFGRRGPGGQRGGGRPERPQRPE